MDYIKDIHPSGDLPYPNLIRALASDDQQGYLMEPQLAAGEMAANGLQRTKEDQALEDEVVQHYETFGSLSHVFQKERLGHGVHEWVFFRRNRGTFEHGLGREDEDTYECAKYNILRHAQEYDNNNPNYGVAEPGLVKDMDQTMLNLANYPFLSGAVMSAPLMPRRVPFTKSQSEKVAAVEGQFTIPRHSQPSALTWVFGTPELCLKLMTEIGYRWGDLSNLSRTCQTVMFAINQLAAHVDLTSSNFMNLNLSDRMINEKIARKKANGIRDPKIPAPGSTAFTIVSSVRGSYTGAPAGEDAPNKHGYPAAPKGAYYRPAYEHRVIDTWKLISSIAVRGTHMKILHLHSVPNLDVSVLEMCLDRLPNLEVLGIHNCELLHFGTAIPVMDAIIAHNEKPGNNFLRADFSPYYYYGIQRQSDGRTGEYGVIASDQGTIETRRAVAAVLCTLIPLAICHGIDWFSPGTGMRMFLDRLPWELGSVRYIIEAIYHIYDFMHCRHRLVGGKAMLAKLSHEDLDKWYRAMRHTLNNDLVLAVHGKAMDRKTLDAMMTSRGKFTLVTCEFCHVDLPAYFFTQQSMNRQANQRKCTGCQLRTYLNTQVDNFHQEKKEVIRQLFNDSQITSIDSFLNGKRVATDAEINNPNFPFWDFAVTNRDDFRMVGDLYAPSVVLDGRPGPLVLSEYKEIWLWKEKLFCAMIYARHNIDLGFQRAQETIAHRRQQVEQLDSDYFDGLNTPHETIENRNRRDEFIRDIDQELARCGQGQMGGRYGATAAANWDTSISRYRQLAQALAGVPQNNGPYPVWDNAKIGFL
ncbi:hypothetical protein F4804DRAFT_348981 [Jackrogersella minutella]|nr:hypothetical protein F4804DRAFT_348981 [Jackrogersella minutella]